MSKEQTDLAVCPFCGSDNAMMLPPTCRPETPYNPADRLFPIVRCGSCCAEVSGSNEDYRGHSAIAAWNRRAPPSPAGGVQVELRSQAIRAMYQFADLTAQHWKNKGAGGPGLGEELERSEQIACDAIAALTSQAQTTGGVE